MELSYRKRTSLKVYRISVAIAAANRSPHLTEWSEGKENQLPLAGILFGVGTVVIFLLWKGTSVSQPGGELQ